MTSSNHRQASRQSRLHSGFARTFGAGFGVPRAGRKLTLTIAVFAVLVTGAATAAWQVNDRETQREIRELQNRVGSGGTVIGELEKINTKLRVDQSSSNQTPEMIAEPTGDEKLDAQQPTTAQVAIDAICPSRTSSMLGQQQHLLCEELVKTELAQYRFSMRMFERAKENYDRLSEIEGRRRNLGADDYADIQYNTNELLALTALMDNDRDRYATYMRAYEARMTHIRNARAALTRNALKGSNSVSVPSM